MTLYLGNNEVSQKVLLNQTVGSNLPAITPETSGKILSNNGTELEWVDKPSGKIVGSFGYTIDEVAPDGCVFCDGGEYEKAKFPDFYQSLVDNKRKSVDYATFDSSVSTNGSCGFFGLDTENEKFKVPMLKDVYLKAGQEPIIFGAESLPNIKGTFGLINEVMGRVTGAFKQNMTTQSSVKGLGKFDTAEGEMDFDASLSDPRYQDEAKVNPDYVAYKVFVVIYNAETEISESQTSEFLNTVNEINNKIDSSRTNCITKIPQDIKLELSEDGTLTLKAGSKVYIPNGAGIFNEVFIENDTSQGIWGTTSASNIMVCVNASNNVFVGSSNDIIYDSDNNQVKQGDNTVSFPIALVTFSNGKIISIDKIFNGLGYIGNTIFVLPGVEGIIPNGRTENGNLNNIKITTTEVITQTFDSATYGDFYWFVKNNNSIGWYPNFRISNENYMYNGNTYIGNDKLLIGKFRINSSSDNGKIYLFNSKNMFQITDRNDTEWASSASKPSNRYIELNLEASGTQYTAPSNGYYCLSAQTTNTSNYIYLGANNVASQSSHQTVGTNIHTNLTVQKGVTVYVSYTGIQNSVFRFIYDEGSK